MSAARKALVIEKELREYADLCKSGFFLKVRLSVGALRCRCALSQRRTHACTKERTNDHAAPTDDPVHTPLTSLISSQAGRPAGGPRRQGQGATGHHSRCSTFFGGCGDTTLDALHDRILQPALSWCRRYHSYVFTDTRDGAQFVSGEGGCIDEMHMATHGFLYLNSRRYAGACPTSGTSAGGCVSSTSRPCRTRQVCGRRCLSRLKSRVWCSTG